MKTREDHGHFPVYANEFPEDRPAKTANVAALSDNAKRAIRTYGYARCVLAYTHSTRGEGPSTIAAYVGLSGVSAANAAINAGREIDAELRSSLAAMGEMPYGC